MDSTEAFIRSCAKKKWSRKMTYEHLGLSPRKFAMLLELMPDIKWPACNDSIGRHFAYDKMRGACSERRRNHLIKARAAKGKKHG
ncbi:hypothetical protein D3C76_407050 [compost metagenome]